MKVAIIGYGEIGKAVHEVVSRFHDTIVRDKESGAHEKVDIMHICYPYDNHFIPTTNAYIYAYKPSLVLIHTTTQVGMTRLLNISIQRDIDKALIVHAPIRGCHKDLSAGIKNYEMYIGCDDENAGMIVARYLLGMGIPYVLCNGSTETELLKLLSLAQYGFNIEFARYAKECCDKRNVEYDSLNAYLKNENETLFKVMDSAIASRHQRFLLEPPEGPIGGHCVLQGMEKLNHENPDKLMESILEKNKELSQCHKVTP